MSQGEAAGLWASSREGDGKCKRNSLFLVSLFLIPSYTPIVVPLSSFPSLFNQAPRIHKASSCKNEDPYLPIKVGYFQVLPQGYYVDMFLSDMCSYISQVSQFLAVPPRSQYLPNVVDMGGWYNTQK